MEYAVLRSGAQMPLVGLGTWTLQGSAATDAVVRALELGYRHIDTAEAYDNHRQIAEGLRTAAIPREDLFIVSKVWRDHLHYEEVLAAAKTTLADLRLDYLDLYLVHWPSPSGVPVSETLTALEELRKQGLIRAIGVSNFTQDHIREAVDTGIATIENNQVPYSPQRNQEALRQLCEREGIVLTAYSPLGRGDLIRNADLQRLAADRGHTVSQIILRWMVEKGIVVIPRSTSRKHLAENLDLFGWELDDEARVALDGMDPAAGA